MKLSRKQIIAIKSKYPNPSSITKAHLEVSRKGELLVIDSNGRSDYPLFIDNFSIGKPNGVYYDFPEFVPKKVQHDTQRIFELK